MKARELRERRLLWPQILTDAEVDQELGACDPSVSPISFRMLREESEDRRARSNCIEYDKLAETFGLIVDSPGWLNEAEDRIGFRRPPGPNRTPSPRCESGKRNYCTCDTCF